MSVEFLAFRWRVPLAGYRWALGRDLELRVSGKWPDTMPRWVLAENDVPGAPPGRREYNPLIEHPELFRTFADLTPGDRDAILAFANQFGWLGVSKTFGVGPADKPEPRAFVDCERVEEW